MYRNRILKEFPVLEGNTKANCIEVTLSYDLGGWNYFTGVKENRGLYLHVSPIEKRDGWRSYTAFTGIKVCVKELARFNKKTFENFIPKQEYIDKLLKHILTINNIKLKDER